MKPSSDPQKSDLVIQQGAVFSINTFQIEVLSYLGHFSDGVHYFKVKIGHNDGEVNNELGLLRVGSAEGGLARELEIRQSLSEYRMASKLLIHAIEDSVSIQFSKSAAGGSSIKTQQVESYLADPTIISEFFAEEKPDDDKPEEKIEENKSFNAPKEDFEKEDENLNLPDNIVSDLSDLSGNSSDKSDYLEEDFYPEEVFGLDPSTKVLILLSDYPDENETLAAYAEADYSVEESLEELISLASQVCQFFRYLYQRGWGVVHIIPQFIKLGKPIQFYDFTNAYPIGESLNVGIVGNYCAPELAYAKYPVHESMSSYVIGCLLYQLLHKKTLPQDFKIEPDVTRIPRIYQLVKITLSTAPEDRFPLNQLLDNLLSIRRSLHSTRIQWNVASRSTVGLSTSRLLNEDNYGIRQQQLSSSEVFLLAVVADGMGGMAQGEVASQLAVEKILEEPIPSEFSTVEQRNNWLLSLFDRANQAVASTVSDGGTTLSAVLAVAGDLLVAHVGDSRIYLLRKGKLNQLSEDHSLVALLLKSGQITEEESQVHPDRSVLTKSLGSKPRLSNGYVQDLSYLEQGLPISLEDKDILLLCSDGVWDLISDDELSNTFNSCESLQGAVDEVVDQVLQHGAPDNATLLALQFRQYALSNTNLI